MGLGDGNMVVSVGITTFSVGESSYNIRSEVVPFQNLNGSGREQLGFGDGDMLFWFGEMVL